MVKTDLHPASGYRSSMRGSGFSVARLGFGFPQDKRTAFGLSLRPGIFLGFRFGMSHTRTRVPGYEKRDPVEMADQQGAAQ